MIFIKISPQYIDYANNISTNLIMELAMNNSINKNIIKLIKGKMPLYGIIYCLNLV